MTVFCINNDYFKFKWCVNKERSIRWTFFPLHVCSSFQLNDCAWCFLQFACNRLYLEKRRLESRQIIGGQSLSYLLSFGSIAAIKFDFLTWKYPFVSSERKKFAWKRIHSINSIATDKILPQPYVECIFFPFVDWQTIFCVRVNFSIDIITSQLKRTHK